MAIKINNVLLDENNEAIVIFTKGREWFLGKIVMDTNVERSHHVSGRSLVGTGSSITSVRLLHNTLGVASSRNSRRESRNTVKMFRFDDKYWVNFNGENEGVSHFTLRDGLKIIQIPVTEKNITVCPLVQHFFDNNQHDKSPFSFQKLFSLKCGIMDEYDTFTASDTPGSIILSSSSSNRKVEIKFGRLISSINNKIKELASNNKPSSIDFESFNIFDSQTIERISNEFRSFQSRKHIKVEFLYGEDVLKGYQAKNYGYGNSTIHKSCMTDKLGYLSIYTKNPKQVSLGVFYDDDKIVARALIWNHNGKQYCDRVYYTQDWMNNLFIDKCKEMDIKPVSELGHAEIKLDQWKFDNYPYLDSFIYMNMEEGTLIYTNPSRLSTLRATNGGYQAPQY